MGEMFYTKSTNPFEAREEIHREEVRRLNAEITRLKIKYGETLNMDEIMFGYSKLDTVHICPKRVPIPPTKCPTEPDAPPD